MDNEYSQFDTTSGNPYEAFDTPSQPESNTLDSAINFVPHQAGLVANAAVKGATALPTLMANIPAAVANTVSGGYNILTGGNAGKIPYIDPYGEGSDALMGKNAQPTNAAERLETSILQPVFSVATGGAAAGQMGIPGALGKNLPVQYGGAVTGGLAGGVTREAGGNPLEQTAASLAGGLAGGVGVGGVQAALQGANAFKAPQDIAIGRLARDFGRDNITPSQATSILQNTPSEYTLADVGDANVKSLGKSVLNTPGTGMNNAINTLVGRQAGATDRVQDMVKAGFGSNAEFNETLSNLQSFRQDAAKPLYDGAFQANQNVNTPAINRILQTPAGQSALKAASVKMQNDMSLMGSNDPELMQQAQLTGQYTPGSGGIASGLKMRSLDYVKRALDDQIGTAINNGENDNVRILSGLKNGLLNSLDEADTTAVRDKAGNITQPGLYSQGRAAWSGATGSQNALEMGRNFLNEDSQLTARTIADLDQGDQKFFQIGAARALADKAAANPNNTIKNILNNDLWKQRLQAALPSKNDYYDFLQNAQNEANMMATKNAVLGNSSTTGQAIKAAEDVGEENPLGLNLGNAISAVSGDWKGPLMQVGKAGLSKAFSAYNKIANPPQVTEQLGNMLFSSDPNKNAATIQAWQQYLQGHQPTPFVNRAIPYAMPMVYSTQ